MCITLENQKQNYSFNKESDFLRNWSFNSVIDEIIDIVQVKIVSWVLFLLCIVRFVTPNK